MNTTFIYALNDPETGECRYVGKTDNPTTRVAEHCCKSRTQKHHCANWIKSLTARGLRPVLEILQEVPKTDHRLWERVWIKASREIGMDLTNFCDGGEGLEGGEKHPMFGKKRSPETLAKMSARMSGPRHPMWGKHISPATSQKKSIAMLGEKNHFFGKKHSQETLEKMTGKLRTPEHCAKISAAKKGKKPSLETRAKMSVAHKARPRSPETYAKCRKKRPGSSSKFHGVSFCRTRNCWRGHIHASGKFISLGRFENERAAAHAYDEAAKKYCGNLAVLNFPTKE